MAMQVLLKIRSKGSVTLFILILQLITGAISDPRKNEAFTSEQSVSEGPPKDSTEENHKKKISVDEPPPLPENPKFLAQLQPMIDQLKEKKPAIWEKIQQTVSNVWNKFGWGKNTNQSPPPSEPKPGLQQVCSLSGTPGQDIQEKVKQTGPDGPNNQNISPVDQSKSPIDHKVTPIDRTQAPIDHKVTPIDHKVTPIDQSQAPVDHKVTNIDQPQTRLDEQSAQAQSPSPNPTVVEEKPEELAVGRHKQPELVAAIPSSKGEVAPPGKREEQTHRQEEAPPQQQQQQQQQQPAPAVDSQVARPVQPSQHQPPVAAIMPPFKLEDRFSYYYYTPPPLVFAPPPIVYGPNPLYYAPPPLAPPSNSYIYGNPNNDYNYYKDKKHAEGYNEFLKRLLAE